MINKIEKKMIYVITDDCVACGSCESACNQTAISLGDNHYEIDETKCQGCGDCRDVCGAGAIVEKD